jgi:hypothetical protein
MSDNNDLVVASGPGGNLHEMPMVVELGEMFGIPAKSLISHVHADHQGSTGEGPEATPAELTYALSVMRQYNLNPMLKQVHCWRDKRGDLCVMRASMAGLSTRRSGLDSSASSTPTGRWSRRPTSKGKSCWESITVTVHDANRGAMVMTPTYLEEWYQPQTGQYPGPWQKQTKHKLHVVAYRWRSGKPTAWAGWTFATPRTSRRRSTRWRPRRRPTGRTSWRRSWRRRRLASGSRFCRRDHHPHPASRACAGVLLDLPDVPDRERRRRVRALWRSPAAA